MNSIIRRNLSGGTASKLTRVQLKHLPYEIGALEPVISGQTMDFHYGKHHRTYVNNLNQLLEQQAEALATGNLQKGIGLTQQIRFNGGGHLNHTLFWDSLCPKADSALPESGPLFDAIVEGWGSVDEFIKVFNQRTAAIQGSGWGWLVYNKRKESLSYRTTANQDYITDVSPYLVPIINVDIWEHAYYMDYRNSRPSYLNKIWTIINWQKAEERLVQAKLEAEQENAAK
jgi:Fe-Mn family superoxide dismutase